MRSNPPRGRQSLAPLARQIDAERFDRLLADLGSSPAGELGALLGTAYPAMQPRTPWQLEAVETLQREGWRISRGLNDLGPALARVTGSLTDAGAAISRLRRAVWAEKARIALRELLPDALGGARVSVTAAELSALASATVQVALAEAIASVERRFGAPLRGDGRVSECVVLGMGKLGGRELNAGSDVDILFFYDTDEGGGEISLHEYWTRVARRAVATLDEPTRDGLLWRVDLRLRPEGSQGPLVNSFAAAERYYETWGRFWERAALLRARPVAGSLELGATFQRELITPFVYRRTSDPTVATQMAELVERARAELSPDPARDLKLGPGGIREAEFFVQTLQLIWGGREPSVRVENTLEALARLRGRGLVSDRETTAVSQAYCLLRECEHHVQWAQGVQTHLLPQPGPELTRMARALGFADASGLDEALSSARSALTELFHSLAPAAPRASTWHRAFLDRVLSDDPGVREELERRFGSDIGEHLRALARRADGLLGELTREQYPTLPDQLLDGIAASSDPDQAARYLRSLLSRFSAVDPYVSLLASDHPTLARLLTALGASRFVGEALLARPDLADLVLAGGGIDSPREVVAMEVEAFSRLVAGNSDQYERRSAFISAMRRAKLACMVSVAVADLAGSIDTREATRLLSDLADEIIEQSVRFELEGNMAGLSVIAMGKLGGRDIGYGSDLDVIFIYDPARAPRPEDAPGHFAKKAQRFLRLMSEPDAHGRGYELDTRLRPSGSQGLLVTSLRSFARYHGLSTGAAAPPSTSGPQHFASGAAWERQALLRARVCAGDRVLGEKVIALAHRAAYERGAPPPRELHDMRGRMQRELARESSVRFDLKTGRGGLLDIEFAAQWLQMRHGQDPAVRSPDTATALEALSAGAYLDESTFATLRDGYQFLRRLEQRIHVLNGTSSTKIDVSAPGLEQLARRMGFQDSGHSSARQALLARYRGVTEGVREAYLRVLGLEDDSPPPSELLP